VTRIAFGLPHTPWIEERVESLQRLHGQLGTLPVEMPYREFTEQVPNAVWSEQMWSWGIETNADWFLTLQDDVEVSPWFWPSLHALLDTLDGLGGGVLGLSSVHPIQVEIARQGHRWYRTRSHLVGWAYAIRHDMLRSFMVWRSRQKLTKQMTEDSLLNHWITVCNHDTYHPVPTIVDHDTTIESSYGNDAHVHRRPWISWRDFSEGSLTSAAFWRPSGDIPLLPTPPTHLCWTGCGRVASVGAGPVRLCSACVANAAATLITRGATL